MAFRFGYGFARSAHSFIFRRISLGDTSLRTQESRMGVDRYLIRRSSDSVLKSRASHQWQGENTGQCLQSSLSFESKTTGVQRAESQPKLTTYLEQKSKEEMLQPCTKYSVTSVCQDTAHTSTERKKEKDVGHKSPLVPDRRIGRFTCKHIIDEDEIEEAQNLLYKVYIEEHGWMFLADNPTGFHLENRNGKMLLKDHLQSQAIWIGVFLNDVMVSCARLIKRDVHGHLDIDRYSDSTKKAIRDCVSASTNPNLVEVQRCATHPRFRNLGVNGLALGLAAEISYTLGVNVIGTTPVDSLRKFLIRCKGRILDEDFDYGDGVPTTVFYWEWKTIPQVIDVIDSFVTKRIMNSSNRSKKKVGV